MKKTFLILLAACVSHAAGAQTYMTRNGQINFFSKTPLEDIRAENKQVYAAIDLSKKTLAFTLLMKGFLFEKQLMQDHFNENYAESDKFPKASFTGTMEGTFSNTPGTYQVQVKGQMTIHGVTKPVTIPATLEVAKDKLNGKADFFIVPEDYNIRIPALVKDKIAKQITVKVIAECLPVK